MSEQDPNPGMVAVIGTGQNARSAAGLLACYLELAKARLAMLVLFTAGTGYLLGGHGLAPASGLLWTLVGTALSAFGANILNQVAEVDRDRRMIRTRNRPLPAGKVTTSEAVTWGIGSIAGGLAVLALGTNLVTTGLSLFVILLYVLAYTPLKARTPLNTAVGAVCGAVPPMMGWAAATGRLGVGAWLLGGILFFWQMPHFFALAWLYRADYARGGFRMLPVIDRGGALTGRVAFLYAAALLPLSATLFSSGVSGRTYLVVSQIVGLAFAALGWSFQRARTERTARLLFLASILYLPVLLGTMVSDMGNGIGHRRHLVQRQPVQAAGPLAAGPAVRR